MKSLPYYQKPGTAIGLNAGKAIQALNSIQGSNWKQGEDKTRFVHNTILYGLYTKS